MKTEWKQVWEEKGSGKEKKRRGKEKMKKKGGGKGKEVVGRKLGR